MRSCPKLQHIYHLPPKSNVNIQQKNVMLYYRLSPPCWSVFQSSYRQGMVYKDSEAPTLSYDSENDIIFHITMSRLGIPKLFQNISWYNQRTKVGERLVIYKFVY